jgi:hypothetical protein
MAQQQVYPKPRREVHGGEPNRAVVGGAVRRPWAKAYTEIKTPSLSSTGDHLQTGSCYNRNCLIREQREGGAATVGRVRIDDQQIGPEADVLLIREGRGVNVSLQ